MITTNFNPSVLTTQRNLNIATNSLNTALERMSTGYKVNCAADDAAGMFVSSKMTAQIRGLRQAQKNTQDGISLLQTADGTYANMVDMLNRLRDLSVQAANGIYDEKSRTAFQQEADALVAQLFQLKEGAQFNGLKILGENVIADAAGVFGVSGGGGTRNTLSESGFRVNGRSYSSTKTVFDSDVLSRDDTTQPLSRLLQNSSASSVKTAAAATSANPPVTANPLADPGTAVSGAVDFSGSQTLEIVVDGRTYTAKNRSGNAQQLSYSIENGVTTFICSNFEISAKDKDVEYNLEIVGKNNIIRTGNKNDTILFSSESRLGEKNQCYGGAGDDTITTYGRDVTVYGEDGNDTITSYSADSTYYGGNGNDTFNLYGFGYQTVYGGEGNDNFMVDRNDNYNKYLFGEGGDDYFLIKSGTGAIINGGTGTNTYTDNTGNATAVNVVNPNAQIESFSANQTKTVLIEGLRYEITNNSGSAQDFLCQNSNGKIRFLSSDFIIKALDNVSRNVELVASRISYYASEAGDTITADTASNIYGGNGNDTITVGSGNGAVLVKAGGGDDRITVNRGSDSTYIDAGDGDDILTVNTSWSSSKILGGAGNDTFYIQGSVGSFIDGGDGDDTFNLQGSNYTIAGGSGNNTVTGNLSGNLYTDMSNSNGKLTEVVFTAANQTKTLTIGGINYTVQNLTDGLGFYSGQKKTLTYSYNAATGEVTFAGNYFKITGESGKAHNIILEGGHNQLYTGSKNDTIVVNGNRNTVRAGSGDDKIVHNGPSCNTIYGDDGNDRIEINKRNDYLVSGGNGNDEIIIRANTVLNVQGNAGDDTYTITSSGIIVTDTEGSNVFNIDGSGNSITAGSGHDSFSVNGNDNVVRGSGGDDYYVVTGDQNLVDGGTGMNYFEDYGNNNTFANVTVDPNSNTIIFVTKNQVEEVTIAGEKYVFKNTNHDNTSPASNQVSYSYNQNTGELLIIGSDITLECADDVENNIKLRGVNNVIQGGSLDDKITVETGTNNYIYGNSGDDEINMKTENNHLFGNDGNDTITVDAANGANEIDGGAGDDIINVNSSNNTNIKTGDGNDNLTIRGNSNTADMGGGNDKLLVVGDSNNVTSTSGDNAFNVSGNKNTITGGSGNETIIVSGSENNVTSGDGDDNFDVNGNSNILTSTSGNNEFDINGSYNEVTGGSGIDNITLTGDENIAQGGDENDIFVVQSGNLNNIDGNAGDRNLLYDNGVDTIYKNVIPVKYNPTEIRLQIGANTNDSITITLGVGFDDFELDFSTAESAAENIVKIDSLMEQINTQRAEIGAVLNRLDSVMTSQITNIENLTSSRSTIIDADIAEESAAFTKNQILQQTASALLAQSQNIHASLVLSLIG